MSSPSMSSPSVSGPAISVNPCPAILSYFDVHVLLSLEQIGSVAAAVWFRTMNFPSNQPESERTQRPEQALQIDYN